MKKALLVSLLVAVALSGAVYALTSLGVDPPASHARREVEGVTRVFYEGPVARPESAGDPLSVGRLQRGAAAAEDREPAGEVRARRALR